VAKTVGLSRAIKIEWLNRTVELVLEGKSDQEIKDALNVYLGAEISSPTNLRKTREILLNIWVRSAEEYGAIRGDALTAYTSGTGNRLALHWVMILLAYPVFADICGLIGKVSDMQDTFTSAWLKEKVFEAWGERTTLLYSIEKILQTMKYIGGVKLIKIGIFEICKYRITDDGTLVAVVKAIMALNNGAYIELGSLANVSQLFPFEYSISSDWLHSRPDFELNNIGGQIVLMNS
jgi:hypothetical protein